MAGSSRSYASSSASDGTASPSGSTRSRSTSSISAYSSAESLDIPIGAYCRDGKINSEPYGGGVYTSLHTTVKILQECRLCLIHIPLPLYPHFVQAILSLILPLSPVSPDGEGRDDNDSEPEEDDDDEGVVPDYPSPNRPSSSIKDFVNISVTPVECSVVCSRESVEKWFAPIIKTLESSHRGDVMIASEEFMAIQVDGEGLDAGQRVLDLTSPLALAGVSIFFITTYFSDYILVPSTARSHVTKALQRRGFVFEKHTEAFVTPHHRSTSTSSNMTIQPPSPPPTTTLSDLQTRTFDALRKQNVTPVVNKSTRLVLCAARRSFSKGRGGGDDRGLYLGLVKCLINRPQFLSVTLTDAEPASLLLQKEMLSMFGNDDVLLGSKDDVLIPIVLDLRGLPVDSTGIVCGVAGKLVGGTSGTYFDKSEAVEMSYLSTARAGTVIVAEEDLSRAVEALGLSLS
ncbi:hypothetical protein DFP73DRAFT_483817 [Morchella snyderi]|nr:hypothetical protein DFP73DRAFT_483817 [Morchella snyderi]